jgi:Flp pilus assembly protein TadG
VAAIDFALVAMPFFLFLFGTLEIVLVFFANAVLENGLEIVARKIRTGEVQAQNMTEQQFRQILCDEISTLLACDAHLATDVRPSGNFAGAQFTDPLDGNGNLRTDFKFDPGHAGDVILARAFYRWDVMTPLIGQFLSNMSDGDRLVVSSMAFRNEPF